MGSEREKFVSTRGLVGRVFFLLLTFSEKFSRFKIITERSLGVPPLYNLLIPFPPPTDHRGEESRRCVSVRSLFRLGMNTPSKENLPPKS
jgi:hypothetical protein